MRETTFKLFVLVVLAQTALLGCEQDYSLKLSSTPQVAVNPNVPVLNGSPSSSPAPSVSPIASPSPVIPTAKSAIDSYDIASVQVPKADILFVIDNSGSMENDQNILASNLSSYISALSAGGVDFHFGIVSTDMLSYYNVSITSTSNPYFGFQNPFPTSSSTAGTLLTKYAGYQFLTNSTPDLANKFANNVKLGIKGSGDERGMFMTLEALSAYKLSNENLGFRRSDAMMVTTIVTDENEQFKSDPVTSGIDNTFVATETNPSQRISRYLSRMAALCPAGSPCPGIRTDLVIDLNAKAPTGGVTYPLSSSVVNSYPDAYLKLKAAAPQTTNTYNISSSTWGSSLASIGSAIADQAKQYRLAHKKIILSLLQVSLVSANGSRSTLASNQYSYIADNAADPTSFPAIDLPAATMQIAAGKKLEVSYQYYPE